MDNKEQEKDISSLELDKGKSRNDYKSLVQKLKKSPFTVLFTVESFSNVRAEC